MTSTIALIGKSGSGKTTIAKAFLNLIKKNFPNSSILLVDNDLSLELSESFGIKTRNTIYGIKSGKHEYKTGIPEGMSKQEFIEWALEDIIVEIDDNVDMIASWFVTPKDCKCISTNLMRESLSKLIDRYDFVIFDCEFDLKYLNLLVDYPINEAIIVSPCNESEIVLSSKIADFSKKYATEGQLRILLNKVKKEKMSSVMDLLNTLELDLLGMIDEYDEIDYDVIANKLEALYPRMNLPQIEMN
ncbi:MAG: AAA family ATPase [Candidatus Gastranaerophilales bacterium]|nr:AAA family ATPase [Candidatus Gastranaerophilales bacterium]